MLDFSWSEFLVVILVAVLAIGPKQLPEVLHGLGKIVRRLQYAPVPPWPAWCSGRAELRHRRPAPCHRWRGPDS